MQLAIDPHVKLPVMSQEKSPDKGAGGLYEACRKFEAFFIQSVFKSMRQTLPDGGLIQRSSGQTWFEEAMDAQVAQEMAGSQDLGLARTLYEQMAGPSTIPADRLSTYS